MFFADLSFTWAVPFVLRAFIKTGISEYLLARPATAEEIAGALKLDEEGVRRLLAFLEAKGLLEKEGASFRIKEAFKRYFDRNSPFFLLPYLERLDVFLDTWGRLDEFLKDKDKARKPKISFETFAKGLFPINWEVAWSLKGLVGRARRVLDVGCGSCVMSIPFAMDGAEVVGIDYPEVVEASSKWCVGRMGVRDRYSFICGDMFEVDWGKGYDLVILGNLLHSQPSKRVQTVFRKCRYALSEKGKVAVVEFVKGYGNMPYVFDIHMFIHTKSGRVYSADELKEIASKEQLEFYSCFCLDPARGIVALLFCR